MSKLAGRTAVVTGASRKTGLGVAIARALAAAGADVCLGYYRPYDRAQPWTDNDDTDIAAVLTEIKDLGVRAAGIEVDLAQPGGPADLLQRARDALGPIHILVNNAAYSAPDGIDQLDAEKLDAHYAVNLRAVALLCTEFARQFDGTAAGRIINLTSGQGSGPMPNELAYAATKGSVDALTVSLSTALGPRGITVNAVDPGATDTGWIDPGLRQSLVKAAPMGRLGLPEDAARLVTFLASDDAAWITGQIIRSRGGA